jgi:hypothetical protein
MLGSQAKPRGVRDSATQELEKIGLWGWGISRYQLRMVPFAPIIGLSGNCKVPLKYELGDRTPGCINRR